MRTFLLVGCLVLTFLPSTIIAATGIVGPDHEAACHVAGQENGTDPEEPHWLTLLLGGLSVLGGLGTIYLALVCFGGCAMVIVLIPLLLFFLTGICAVSLGIWLLTKRRSGREAGRRWMSVLGGLLGALSSGFGLYALISMIRG